MFGKIIKIDGNDLYIKNESHTTQTNLMNCHVIFEEDKQKFVGEIVFIDEEIIKVLLVGEIVDGVFSSGAMRKPSGNAIVRIINSSELELIIGKNSYNKNQLLIGKSAIYNDFNVSVSLNDFFANHSAIIGNTGSGKSCGVARILQNLFISNNDKPVNAHFVLFDAYGEYIKTFDAMNNDPRTNVRKFSTKPENEEEPLKFPTNFLEADDLALLLSLEDSNQIPVLEKALQLVNIFKNDSPNTEEYKNDIIAKCLLDILTSGNTPSQCRDQIFAVLSNYNTESLNLDSVIKQPGYNRSLRQCLLIDDKGKINAISEVMDFLKTFERVGLDGIPIVKNFAFTLDELYNALEFALISEGSINSTKQYENNNIIKARLLNIINSEYKEIFNCDYYLTKEEYVKQLFQTMNGDKVQLININLSHVDDRFAKILTKLYAKVFFTFTTKLKPRGVFSINLILEEAHRYVQNDNDINVIGYNIFDRITKEGRKYGTMLTFITQRPSELSTTALSQCSNFLVFRIFHPNDLEIVRNISTSVNEEVIEKLKTLNPGVAMIFGVGLKLPIVVKLQLPNPMPESTSLNLSGMWYENETIIF